VPEQDGAGPLPQALHRSLGTTPRPGLRVLDHVPDAGTAAELVVVLATACRDALTLPEGEPVRPTLIAVAAGAATATTLARAAVAADRAGQEILGLVLADPEEGDHTAGDLADADAPVTTLPTTVPGIARTGVRR